MYSWNVANDMNEGVNSSGVVTDRVSFCFVLFIFFAYAHCSNQASDNSDVVATLTNGRFKVLPIEAAKICDNIIVTGVNHTAIWSHGGRRCHIYLLKKMISALVFLFHFCNHFMICMCFLCNALV